jgi:hypothetical protein
VSGSGVGSRIGTGRRGTLADRLVALGTRTATAPVRARLARRAALARLAGATLATLATLARLAGAALAATTRPRLVGPTWTDPVTRTEVHGLGDGVLLHEQLEPLLLGAGRVDDATLGECPEVGQPPTAPPGVVAGMAQQHGVGRAGRGTAHGGDGLPDEGEIG